VAASVLGVHEVTSLDYLDQRPDHGNARLVVAAIVWHLRRVQPDVVVTFRTGRRLWTSGSHRDLSTDDCGVCCRDRPSISKRRQIPKEEPRVCVREGKGYLLWLRTTQVLILLACFLENIESFLER
jgi:hypothetical protein